MTKKDLIKWLKQQKSKAVGKARTKYSEALDNRSKQIWNEFEIDKYADILFKDIQKLSSDYEEFKHKIIDTEGFIHNSYSYGSLHGFISRFKTKADVFDGLCLAYVDKTQYTCQLKEKNRDFIYKVEAEYDKLIANVIAMKKATDAISYLESLGLKINVETTSNSSQTTVLATPIDTSFLLMLKEGENNE